MLFASKFLITLYFFYSRGRQKKGRYEAEKWNNYEITKDQGPRTNNAVESWHNTFNFQLTAKHPTLWDCIDAINSEQCRTEFELKRANCHIDRSPVRKRQRDNESRLQEIVANYGVDKYKDKVVYLKAIATCLKL